MPITLRPGIVATRADSADMLRAMSSASWITRLALIPLAGSSSYIVTTGPGRTSTMSPRTWKSSSTLSSRRALRSSPARSIGVLLPAGAAPSKASGGSVKLSPSARLACPAPLLPLRASLRWAAAIGFESGPRRRPRGASAAVRRGLRRRARRRACWCGAEAWRRSRRGRGGASWRPSRAPRGEARARDSRAPARQSPARPSATAAAAPPPPDCRSARSARRRHWRRRGRGRRPSRRAGR